MFIKRFQLLVICSAFSMVTLMHPMDPSVHPDVRKLAQDVDTLLESAPGSTNKASYNLIKKRIEARLRQIDQQIAQLKNEQDALAIGMMEGAYRVAIRDWIEKIKLLEQKAK